MALEIRAALVLVLGPFSPHRPLLRPYEEGHHQPGSECEVNVNVSVNACVRMKEMDLRPVRVVGVRKENNLAPTLFRGESRPRKYELTRVKS